MTPRPRSALAAAFHLACLVLGLGGASALAQPDANGYEWATITHPNNPAYNGFDPFGYVAGRGSVGYEYRLARSEVSTGQWLEFFNTFSTRAQPVPWVIEPRIWGAVRDTTYPGPGVRYRLGSLAQADQLPAYGVMWRTAALYCNWLHNNRSSDPASLLSGAYDVSTFHDNPDGTFTDQATRSPGARYWIPSLDEWLKAAHWDPNHQSNNGWWTYSNGLDVPLTYGPPPSFGGDGTGQANAGFHLLNFREYNIPLGSYPNTPSVWGLLDIAGCGSEWTEEIQGGRLYRAFDGSYAASGGGLDTVYGVAAQAPWSLSGDYNLRLASSVPNVGTTVIVVYALCVLREDGRSRRRTRNEEFDTSPGGVPGNRSARSVHRRGSKHHG